MKSHKSVFRCCLSYHLTDDGLAFTQWNSASNFPLKNLLMSTYHSSLFIVAKAVNKHISKLTSE